MEVEHLAFAECDINEAGDCKEGRYRCELVKEHLEQVAYVQFIYLLFSVIYFLPR